MTPGEGALRIRAAQAEDADLLHAAIARMAEGLGQGERVVSRPEQLRRHGFGPRPAFEALIAEDARGFVGAVIFFPSFSSWRGEAGAYVLDLYVEPAARGRGVGDALLRRVAALTAERGGAYLRLSADATNAAAHGFYRALGFTEKREEAIFALTGDAFARLSGARSSGGGPA